MATKIFKALCLLVNFLIDESPVFSQPVTLYRFCRASTTILNNHSYGPNIGYPNILPRISVCKDKFDRKNGDQKGNTTKQTTMDPKQNDKDRNCWYIELTDEKCNKRKSKYTRSKHNFLKGFSL
nr:uncharacterized protein LOC117683033 [Crassostrea gigas]